nr:probable rhamnogalacturonate lyase B isoform X1 [Coffea arabica]XP_027077819.1 probable rhamnogalacturonate lyase B isoform X1 [Coffea arabica]
MGKMSQRRQWRCVVGWFGICLLQLLLLAECTVRRQRITKKGFQDLESYPPVRLHLLENHVVMDNGLVNVTLSVPEGMVTGIEYNGIANLLEERNKENDRGYWDIVWNLPEAHGNIFDKLAATSLNVVLEDENGIELSFTRTYDDSINEAQLSLNIDKRFILLRGYPGFYTYGIFERLEGWPDINVYQGRTVFKLQEKLFEYMAVSDERQRIMPTADDRARGQILDYPEAVLLTNPANTFLRGEVDDKYQYSSDNKDNRIHGWICPDSPTGFWMITPSNEFKTGGPVKQDLTSHVGPTTLSMYFSTHYAGEPLAMTFRDGEPWRKVFGPVFVYLNTLQENDTEPLSLWADAKEHMLIETESWPYSFPLSEDYSFDYQRGSASGRLLIQDSYISERLITGNSAFVGLAAPGDAGSWQTENKAYQFWAVADSEGYFLIKNVRPGNYSLYAWVPGYIGDYKYDFYVNIRPGSRITLGALTYNPPRNGPTLWEIGIPDRTAIEFFIPEPSPRLMNQLYSVNQAEKFRQYGLWDRYSELYPSEDLVFTVGVNNYQTDWFFAHVNRNVGNKTYVPTTWQIAFDLDNIDFFGTYMLQIALASANEAELQVRINNPDEETPYFTTGTIGKDNAIARHGIHGLYMLYSLEIPGSQLLFGRNIIYLTQSRGSSPWRGIMYDYLRLEGPPEYT